MINVIIFFLFNKEGYRGKNIFLFAFPHDPLVNDFDGEFDLIGLLVGVEFDEGFEETGHGRSARFGGVLRFDFLLGF